jgi:hypothetical protein
MEKDEEEHGYWLILMPIDRQIVFYPTRQRSVDDCCCGGEVVDL